MSAFRTVLSIASNNVKAGVKTMKNSQFRPLLSCAPVMLCTDRPAHSQDLTKNIQYISNDGAKLHASPDTMRLDRQLERPLCVMINWMLARHKHVMKYASLYLEQGFDVLSVSCTPWQLMWPTKGSQLVARDLLHFMSNNPSLAPVMVHGFSVGGYMWGELCLQANANKPLYQPVLDRVVSQVWDSAADISEITTGMPAAVFPKNYQPALDRVVSQVWDSAADISEITIGVPAAVFPKNKMMQRYLQTYMEYHMKTFHESATIHYMRSSQQFHLNSCHAPALFLLSKTDPVGSEASNKRVLDSWVNLGIKCTWKVFDKSPHVQHYIKHPKEYLTALYEHLNAANLLSQPEKMRMRI